MKNHSRRHAIRAVTVTIFLTLLTSGSAIAQAWRNKPITLIVPFPPGGTTDVLARALGEKLSQNLGQPVIVGDKAGEGREGTDFIACPAALSDS